MEGRTRGKRSPGMFGGLRIPLRHSHGQTSINIMASHPMEARP